jgi:isochorismate hydrolase
VGPLIPELAEALQDVPKIERTTVNAWTEKRVVDAVKATGRKQLMVTGISTDVCLAFPAISALADGYETLGVIDASGAFTKMQGMQGMQGVMRMMQMMQAGVVPVAYSNLAVEILADNAAPEAQSGIRCPRHAVRGLVYGLNQYFSHE